MTSTAGAEALAEILESVFPWGWWPARGAVQVVREMLEVCDLDPDQLEDFISEIEVWGDVCFTYARGCLCIVGRTPDGELAAMALNEVRGNLYCYVVDAEGEASTPPDVRVRYAVGACLTQRIAPSRTETNIRTWSSR